MEGRPEANAEEATARVMRFFDGLVATGEGDGMRMTVESDPAFIYSPRLAERSFLKSAYLAAFDRLGFPYILAPELKSIRQQMLQPEADLVIEHSVLFSPQPRGIDRRIGLAYAYEPVPVAGLAVLFFGYRMAKWPAVFLPLPAHPDSPQYGSLQEALRLSRGMGMLTFDAPEDAITNVDFELTDGNGQNWSLFKRPVSQSKTSGE